jgi:hypothetical protein
VALQERKALEQRIERLQKVVKCDFCSISCTRPQLRMVCQLWTPAYPLVATCDLPSKLQSCGLGCRDRRSELDEAQLNLAALKTLSDEVELLRARVTELEPLQVMTYAAHWSPLWQKTSRRSRLHAAIEGLC